MAHSVFAPSRGADHRNTIRRMTSGLSPITIRLATPADAARLAAVAASSFIDTFGAANTADDMAMYVAGAFGESIQRAELSEARHTVLFAERDGVIAGYAMMREGHAPAGVHGSAIEIARLYSVTEAIGSGVGATLMRACLAVAAERRKAGLWLGVWERNARAIAFYARWGFVDVGSQSFMLGRDVQTDRVMARVVSAAG